EWGRSPLGSPQQWPQSLRSAISIALNSNFPIAIYWGKDLTLLYNDAWSPIPGDKHPWALGKPAKDVWPEIWENIEPQFEKAFDGEPGGSKDALLPMQRHGYTEECYFDFTFTPVYGESEQVEGVFNAVIETTYRVINERRSKFLKELTLKLSECSSKEAIADQLIPFIGQNNEPTPFAFFYNIENETPRLVSSTVDDLDGIFKNPWPYDRVPADEKVFYINDLSEHLHVIPKSFWPESPVEAVLIPCRNTANIIEAFLVCGINSRRRYDNEFRVFFENLADIINTNLRSLSAIDAERKKAALLAEVNNAKTIFFSNISHELRTPLTLMLGSIEDALKEPKILPSNLTRLNMAHRNAMRLLRMVNNLLDFSRIEAGRMNAQFELTDIARYTRDLASTFRSIIENAGLKFNVNCEYVIQPVYIDKVLWEKIVLNLLSNAFKYTLNGSISISLGIASNNFLELKVTDTGVGIPDEELPNMFQRFHRVQGSAGRTHEGTGIGLSLVSELVKLHGGEVSVSSKLNVGSEFTVMIPTGKKHLQGERILEKETDEQESIFTERLSDTFIEESNILLIKDEPGIAPGSSGKRSTILVVDDNSDMRNYLQYILQNEFQVITANNGLEALHKIKELPPDLILSDIMMPVMDGIQLLKTVKANPGFSNIPVILLTARAGEESRIEGYNIGADDYLVKPFSTNELKARVGAHIRLKQRRDNALNTFYTLFDGMPFAVVALKGEDLVIDFVNQFALDIWQKEKDEVIGRPLYNARPEIRDISENMFRQVYQTGKRYEATEIPVHLNHMQSGDTLYFNSLIDPMFDEHGNIIGQLAISLDVTEKVLARKNRNDNDQ
ncbi:MAG TPA: response regulator, partial [Ferruginibacter sp.]|nr:response regulator [Ferruginibacter sp.]